jgi:hypothetical protein
LLAECDALRIVLTAVDEQIEIDAEQEKLTPELLARLKQNKAELLALLRSAGQLSFPRNNPVWIGERSDLQPPDMAAAAAPRPRPAVPVAVEWPAAAADFALLLAVDDLPPVPYRSNAWTETRDAGKLLRWLRADILRGPGGPRAFYGALQADLRELQRFALQAADNRQRQGRPQR